MRSALYPGVFDPPTTGHIEIIQRAAQLFDKLYVAVSTQTGKRTCFFTADERRDLIRTATTALNNVEIITFSGLAVDCAKNLNINVLVRGLRNGTDFDYEYQMAAANRQMTGVETVFLVSSPKDLHLSSTLIREIATNGRRLHDFVPKTIEEQVFKRLSQSNPSRACDKRI